MPRCYVCGRARLTISNLKSKMKDYYKILGVPKNASPDEIKKAFRKLAHEHHPDKAGGNAEKFKEILQAYQVLSDAEKRKQYDQFGTTFEETGRGGTGGFQGFDFGNFDFNSSGFEDLSDVLGGMFSFGGGGRRASRRPRGKDIEKNVDLDFIESVFGVTKKIELYSLVGCEKCRGSGAEQGSSLVTCKRCNGAGQVKISQQNFFGNIQFAQVCDECGGAGRKPEKECGGCRGVGVARELKKIEVKIPAGVDAGGVLRVMGQGEAAQRGGDSGDLFLHIRVRPDARFERRGHNIFSRVPISFKLAALGGKARIETVDGPVELKIPAGTQPGALFSLRDKGVPREHRGRGDQIVEVTIAVPTKLSKKQKQAAEEFGDES